MKLQPAIVTGHLLGGVGLLALLTWLALRESPSPPVDPRASGVRWLAAVAVLLLVVQIALGGWVSTNYAVLACPDYPTCHGRLVPPQMDFGAGFTLWRDLGMTADGTPIAFQALVAIHWTHRSFAYLVVAVLGLLAWRLWSLAGLAGPARALAAVLALQFATGLSSVLLGWPLLLAVLHNGGAAVLLALLVTINYRLSAGGNLPVGGALARAPAQGRG